MKTIKILATVTFSKQVEVEIPDCLLGLSERKIRKIQKDIFQAAGNGSENMQITEVIPANPAYRCETKQDELDSCLVSGKSWVDN